MVKPNFHAKAKEMAKQFNLDNEAFIEVISTSLQKAFEEGVNHKQIMNSPYGMYQRFLSE